MKGNVFNIQRFSTNDGPGIRTTVFLKGCPLSCIWCHNPESKGGNCEILFDSEKCMMCAVCENVCKNKAHIFKENGHIYLRENCTLCKECADKCPVKALEVCGKELTADEVLTEVLKDKEFYKNSGGGITLSGGEPLMQYDFSLEILKKAKDAGINTAMETSGYCSRSLEEIGKFVDLWLYDIKVLPEKEHIEYTGVSNKKILENLFYLDNSGAEIILRCPVIPDVNMKEEHFEGILKLLMKLKNVKAVNLEPYHPLGIDKAKKAGMVQKYENRKFLSKEEVMPFDEFLKNKTDVKIEIM